MKKRKKKQLHPIIIRRWSRGDNRKGNPQRFIDLSCGHTRYAPKTCQGVDRIRCLKGCLEK